MTSFFNRKSEMFDVKKKRLAARNAAQKAGENSAEQIDAEEAEHDADESNPESWVDVAGSRTSLCSSVEAVTFDEANSSIYRDSRLSPISLQSPCVELESNLEQVKYRLAKDVLPKNTDWLWDWSSRPEALPHTSGIGSGAASLQLQQITSALTTPPNSPEPDLLVVGSTGGAFDFSSPLRPRVKKPSIFSSLLRFEVIVGLVVSNLMTFVLGATIGFCICKKVRKGDSEPFLRLNYNYY